MSTRSVLEVLSNVLCCSGIINMHDGPFIICNNNF